MKLYSDGIGEPVDEKSNEFLLKMEELIKSSKEILPEKEQKQYTVKVHNYIRIEVNLENQLFTIGTNKEGTKAAVIYFPKEPDGKCYDVHKDEDGKLYIIVEDEE